MALKDWKKVKGHNEWINIRGNRTSVSFILNGENKGKYSFMVGSSLDERNQRKVLLERNFDSQSEALAYAKNYMRTH